MKIKEIIVIDDYPYSLACAEEALKGAVHVSTIVRPRLSDAIPSQTVILAFYPEDTEENETNI